MEMGIEMLLPLLFVTMGYVMFLALFLGTFMTVTYAVRYAVSVGNTEKKELPVPVVVACLVLSIFLIAMFVGSVVAAAADGY